MPNSSSKVRIALPRSPRDVRLALADRALPVEAAKPAETTATAGAGSTPAADARRRHFDIKELQRRAFERGRAVERERLAGPTKALIDRLAQEADARARTEVDDRSRVEDFAVSLALAVAERLTHALVAHREHDVRAMVQELLERSSAGGEANEELQLALEPDDHARLVEMGISLPEGLTLTGDASLAPGDLRLRGRHHETWARLSERLESVRHEFVEEAQRHDA